MELLFRTTAVESLSDKDKLEYYSYMTTERDRRNQEAYALEKSHNEGLQQGIQQGRQEGLQEGIVQGLQEGRQEGRQEGLQEGLQEGIEKGRLEMAQLIKNLRLSGMNDAKIAQMAGLSEEEIKAI